MPLSPDALLAGGISVLGIAVTIVGAGWRLAVRMGNTEARLAAEQAKHAEAIKAQVNPISNGFAASVKESLARIEAAQTAQVQRMDNHLEHHSDRGQQ